MPGPLSGYRVVDLTAMITGPFATMILGDQGADVIKIEPPGLGDVMRWIGTSKNGIAAFWALTNRSKRSVVLNLREPRARALLLELVARADVFVQNFRPGVVERLGLDEPSLRAIRPELVYVSISAFGASGPYAHKPAYDHILQGITGFAYAQADPATGRPVHVKNAICDKLTALVVAQGITAALLARERASARSTCARTCSTRRSRCSGPTPARTRYCSIPPCRSSRRWPRPIASTTRATATTRWPR